MNVRKARAVVTRYGCDRVESFEGCVASREREGSPGNRRPGPETRRTPRSVAGCNKPATLETPQGVGLLTEMAAEKTGEVVRNHEVGTGLLVWLARGRRCGGDIALGVDAGEHVDGGVIGRWRADCAAMYDMPTRPGESQERWSKKPTGARICSSEGERRLRALGLHARTPRGDRVSRTASRRCPRRPTG